jgi:hypothetical protein
MSLLVSAIDHFTPSKVGENGSIEYTWSHDLQDRILQLSFQITRTKDQGTIKRLEKIAHDILKDLNHQYNHGVLSREVYVKYMSLFYRMVGHTRDIIEGKGEYELSYMLLCVWQQFHPRLAEFALKHFLLAPENNATAHPYGCWKDIKYLYGYSNESPLVDYGLGLMGEQIRCDATAINPSLAAKWAPRQKSKYDCLFTKMAISYYSSYLETAKTPQSMEKAVLKAKTDFRKTVSAINKKLDTVQIKQCGKSWATIDPTKQTSITMQRQKKAFLNKKKNGEQRSELEDRVQCAEHFVEFASKAAKGEVVVKGKRVGMNDFTSEALSLITQSAYKNNNVQSEINILNAQWEDNSTQNGELGNMIVMADVSGSMNGDPLNACIALAIRIAQKSKLGKRVLTFSATPKWHNLDGLDTFYDMVKSLKDAEWGMNTNLYAALDLILDAIILNKLSPDHVENMILVVLSDMQIDSADSKYKSLMAGIQSKYADAGMKVWGTPFKAPHILFWNLRSTNGFPMLSTEPNCSMVSGFNPVILNEFCEEGLEALQNCTPWSQLEKSLQNERYDVLKVFLETAL